MSQTLATEQRPLRVAIIGAGPSGFYAADALFRAKIPVVVDAFDRLPTPFGLLRGGVAPDHQQMKTVGKYYERVAATPGFSFWGNVKVGQDISVEELKRHYDVLIFSSGAETDRHLEIPGESLIGSNTATAFVGWYNGHPDYRDHPFDLTAEAVAIIGQGNVAIDVARILAKTPHELKDSDIADHAMQALAKTNIKDIYLIGRRGPVQSAFTELEIKELGELEDCDVIVNPKDMVLNAESQAELDDPTNNKARKNVAVLHEFSTRQPQGKKKRIHVLFFKSPIAMNGESHVTGLTLEHNHLEGPAGKQKAVASGETETLPCTLVFRSVGYRGVPIEGVPFDPKRGVFPNEAGRILDGTTPVPGMYCSGWIKRGPSGVLGTNKPDSAATIASVLEDLPNLKGCEVPDSEAVRAVLNSRQVQVVSFEDWKHLDAEEVRRGETVGKPREKFTRVEDVLSFLRSVLIEK